MMKWKNTQFGSTTKRGSLLRLFTSAGPETRHIEGGVPAHDPARQLCLHHLIEQQASRTPDAMALVFEQQRLTYHDLVNRASRLAHYLRGQGAGPDKVIGVFMERSLDLVVAILGILKSGAAYL